MQIRKNPHGAWPEGDELYRGGTSAPIELGIRQLFTDASLQAKTSRDESREDEDEEDAEKRMTDPRKVRIDARLVNPSFATLTPMRALLPLLLLLIACDKSAPPPTAGPTIGPPSAAPAPAPAPAPGPTTDTVPLEPPRDPCGTRIHDWCPSPAGDPCGEHKDVNSCRADPKCKGMPYKGESIVACRYDGGFATNCPTVGCISR
jgi:hypothetical protein